MASEVLEIGENDRGIKAGDKVVVMPYISDPNSVASRNGKPNCCPNITVLGVHGDGGMQEKITVPADILLKANNLSDNEMAIVEPLAIGAHAVRRAAIQKGEIVAVVGAGPIGIGIMKLAQIAGAKVIAIDMNQDRLTYAKEKIGVDYIVTAREEAVEEVLKITNGDLCNAVFDASGNKYALEDDFPKEKDRDFDEMNPFADQELNNIQKEIDNMVKEDIKINLDREEVSRGVINKIIILINIFLYI